MMPSRSLFSKPALLLLSAALCLRVSWGAGEDAQSVENFYEDFYGNDKNETAMSAASFDDILYVAITTESDLAGTNAGGSDLVVQTLDASLDEDISVQLGSDGDDILTAIAAPATDADTTDIVIVGSTSSEVDHLFPDIQVNATGAVDWFIATLERASLETVEAYVNGTEFEDQTATAVAITANDDGEAQYVVAGWTWGDYFSENAGADNDESAIGYDVWVVKMDAELSDDFLWSTQMGTIAYDEPSAVLVGPDGDVYVVGTTTDSSDILDDDEKEEFQAMFVYCLDGDTGEEEWSMTTELGFMSDASELHGAVLTTNGTTQLYISGNTQGIIPGFDGNTTDTDEFFIVSLSPLDGEINWVWQSEGNATVFGDGGIVLADDGLTPIVSGIAFGNLFNLSSPYWEFGTGDMVAAMVGTEELEVVKYFVAAADNTETRERPYAMVKDENEELGIYMIGITDGEWGDEDSDPEDTSNYLVLQAVLETIPEEEEEDDGERDFDYWYIALAVFALGGILFFAAYKWAAASQAAKAKQATMV